MEESDISKRDSPAVPVGNGYGGACGGMGCSLPDVVGEEHQAVGDVHVAHTAVEVERKQVHLRVEGFYPFLDPFGYDVVGDAAERLQADDVVHSRAGESDDFGRQEPALAELR